MKCLLIINLTVFIIIVVNSDKGKRLFLPQLPFGKYRAYFLGAMRCTSVQSNNKIIYNYYISKKSANATEIKGNLSNSIPIDDSLTLDINMAVKDSIGGWKENAFSYKAAKACSSLKFLMGNAWIPITERQGIYHATCPIPVGVYVVQDLNTEVFMGVNFPESFFYGTYKIRFAFTKNNEFNGCQIFVVEVKRPWENNS